MQRERLSIPLCVRCSAPNANEAVRCIACGAGMPRMAGPADESHQLFSLEEGRDYPAPSESFDSENLAQLRMAIEDYLEGGSAREVQVWLRHIDRHLREFIGHGVTQLNRALDVERQLNSEGDFHHHVGYLVRKGCLLCEQGLEAMEQALQADDGERLSAEFETFRQGNDHICTALLMIADRQELLAEAAARFAPEDEES